ncbi:GNAT family N-acetyltransferase [Georgenia sp.]
MEQGVEGLDFPGHWAADVVLRDGSTMHIRPIRPSDAPALERMHARLSDQSIYFRFFAPLPRLSEKDLYRFTHVDHRDRVALVLVEDGEIHAVGRYDVITAGEAEVAFNVVDSDQGRGLGSILLDHLAAAGRERGIARFVADVLPANARMIRVFADAGYEVEQRLDDGYVRVTISIEETERSWRVMAEREQHAEALSMAGLLQAASILVLALGDDGDEGQALAGRVADSLLASEFTGPLHLVGLGAGAGDAVHVHRHASLSTVPAPVDLALVAGPPADVVASVGALHGCGVRALVVLSHGFGESGPEGMTRQHALLAATRAAGLRVVGPASYGVVGNGPAGRYNATLWAETGPGAVDGVSLFTQSVAAALSVRSTAERRAVPVATMVSAGNRVDVSGNDTLQYWSGHEGTRVGAVYLESIGNPRKFSRVARAHSLHKPLVAIVSGQTGQSTPPGHAVRTSRQPPQVLAELLRRAGVVRARSVREMLDVAALLQAQPLPAGPRTAVVSSSTALAGLVAEVLRAHELQVAPDPVTLPPLAGAAQYEEALARLAGRDDFDAVIVAHAQPLGSTDTGVAAAIARAAAADGRTWLASVFGFHGLVPALTSGGTVVPAMGTVEDAVTALSAAVRYATWRTAVTGATLVAPVGIEPARARRVVAAVLEGAPAGELRELDAATAAEVLGCYGIAVLPAVTVADADEAVAAAEAIGWPVALKTSDLVLRHRTDLGGVRLDLGDADALREALKQMATRVAYVLGRSSTFEVQAVAPPGVACVVRGTEDELYGPVVAFGLAGTATELLGDISYGVPPLTGPDVTSMVRSVRAAPRLFGHRGLPVADIAALEDVIARVSMLTDDLPEVADVLLNPVIVAESGLTIASARVSVAWPLRQDAGRRALPTPPPLEPAPVEPAPQGGAQVGQ